MYKSFLSYSQLKDYIVLIIENDLPSFDSDTQKYTITDKEFKFMKQYEKLGEIIPGVDLFAS